MQDVDLDLDATEWHTCSVEWTAHVTRVFVDDQLVREVGQGMTYPLQVMVDLFEFPAEGPRDAARYPKVGDVSAVRGHVAHTADSGGARPSQETGSEPLLEGER